MNDNELIVIESFQVSGIGLLVFLQNVQNGLPANTILKSQATANSWKVKNRIIQFSEEIIFENEKVSWSHLRFATLSDKIKSVEKKESQMQNRIFQYLLEGDEKPVKNEVLVIC